QFASCRTDSSKSISPTNKAGRGRPVRRSPCGSGGTDDHCLSNTRVDATVSCPLASTSTTCDVSVRPSPATTRRRRRTTLPSCLLFPMTFSRPLIDLLQNDRIVARPRSWRRLRIGDDRSALVLPPVVPCRVVRHLTPSARTHEL